MDLDKKVNNQIRTQYDDHPKRHFSGGSCPRQNTAWVVVFGGQRDDFADQFAFGASKAAIELCNDNGRLARRVKQQFAVNPINIQCDGQRAFHQF